MSDETLDIERLEILLHVRELAELLVFGGRLADIVHELGHQYPPLELAAPGLDLQVTGLERHGKHQHGVRLDLVDVPHRVHDHVHLGERIPVGIDHLVDGVDFLLGKIQLVQGDRPPDRHQSGQPLGLGGDGAQQIRLEVDEADSGNEEAEYGQQADLGIPSCSSTTFRHCLLT